MHKAIAHNRGDHVAVAVAEISAGEEIVVVYMDDEQAQATIRARADVPYGHKVAVEPVAADERVIEYSTEVGVARSRIEPGDYVHVHNVKTARW